MADADVERRNLVKSKIVKVIIAEPHFNNQAKASYKCIAGTVIVAETNFCYVMVERSLIQDGLRYYIHLPDRSAFQCEFTAFSVPPNNGKIAGFFIYRDASFEYDTTKVTAVKFGSEASSMDKVHLGDFENQNAEMFLTPGYVVSTGIGMFHHDCSPGPYSKNGAPVFDENGDLVGIGLGGKDLTRALNVKAITEELSKLHQGTKDMDEILRRVRSTGAIGRP